MKKSRSAALVMKENLVHLLAGGLGGTAGAVITCPLEVLKTRMQSSDFMALRQACEISPGPSSAEAAVPLNPSAVRRHWWQALKFVRLFRYIQQTEGWPAFFKGLGPNLIGVAPSRAIYFCAYSWFKSVCNQYWVADSVHVHIFSAAGAGFCAATVTNPIWLVKTRLQLDRGAGVRRLTILHCVSKVYRESGVRGFYKGVQASYLGVSEKMIQFVLYEKLKTRLVGENGKRTASDFFRFMGCAASSRLVAALVTYPYNVIRTRLREEGTKYRRLLQTAVLIYKEEHWHAFYRGLGVHLIRTIPNTTIYMSIYELIVYLCLR